MVAMIVVCCIFCLFLNLICDCTGYVQQFREEVEAADGCVVVEGSGHVRQAIMDSFQGPVVVLSAENSS